MLMKMYHYVIWSTVCVLFCVLTQSMVESSADEKSLYKTLFQDYEASIRPKKNASDAVMVHIGLDLLLLKEIEEKSQTHRVVGIFNAEWTDDYLTWNSTEYGNITRIVVPSTNIWLPDFGILNSAADFYQEAFYEHFRVHISNTGRVVWDMGGMLVTTCAIDTTWYPMDKQNCTIVIENWAYTKNAVQLIAQSHKVRMNKYADDGIWNFIGSSVWEEDTSYPMHPGILYPRVKFSFEWQRKPRYYIVNVMLPCFFLLCVAMLVFWLPPDAGEKVSLGITVLLAFSVFQLIIADNTPENSDSTPLLSMFVTLAMALSTTSVITTVLVLHLHFKPPVTPAPRWLKYVSFNVIARVICVDKQLHHRVRTHSDDINLERAGSTKLTYGDETAASLRPNDVKNRKNNGFPLINQLLSKDCNEIVERNGDGSDFEVLGARLQEMVIELRILTKKLVQKDEVETYTEEWQEMAIVLDRLFFWIAVSVFVISCLAMFYGK